MIKIATLATLFISGALLISSCNNAGNTKAPTDKDSTSKDSTGTATFDLTSAKMDIEDANRNLVLLTSAGDSVALANYYTADAEIVKPNKPAIVGRKDIQKEISSMIKAGVANLDLKILSVSGDEKLLTEKGVFTLASKDNKQIDKGKYTVLWKREEGKLKLFRDSISSDAPAAVGK